MAKVFSFGSKVIKISHLEEPLKTESFIFEVFRLSKFRLFLL